MVISEVPKSSTSIMVNAQQHEAGVRDIDIGSLWEV